jgi:hypothetical protein
VLLRLKTNGDKRITEAMACVKMCLNTGVGERSLIDTSLTVRTGGEIKEVSMLV